MGPPNDRGFSFGGTGLTNAFALFLQPDVEIAETYKLLAAEDPPLRAYVARLCPASVQVVYGKDAREDLFSCGLLRCLPQPDGRHSL